MEFGIFNLMGSRDPEKPTVEVFAEVAEQTRLADELGYAFAWFAEHHFSNYCLCASPLMLVAHCASITKKIRLGTAVVVLPLYNPARLAAEIATADALSNGRLMLGVGAGYQPYEFERFGVDIKANLEMTEEFCDILDRAFSQDFFSYEGKHYQIPKTRIPARPVQKPLPIYVAGHTEAMFRAAARHGYRVLSSGRVGGAALLAEQYQVIKDAFSAEGVPLANAHITVNRFCHITDSKEEGLRFAENARYQSRLASSLRRRQEVMQGTVLVDVPFPDEPPRPAKAWSLERLLELFPALRERTGNKGSQLSGGDRKTLATARALVSDQKVLLLDEPSQGLAPLVVRELARVIRLLSQDGVTIL